MILRITLMIPPMPDKLKEMTHTKRVTLLFHVGFGRGMTTS
jgi:hypothetical protein